MKEKDWASGTLKEVPFWRNEMQPEEYDYERSYFHQNWENYTNGKYIPLWKQIEQSKNYNTIIASFEHEFKIAIYCRISNEMNIDYLKSVIIDNMEYNVLDYQVIWFPMGNKALAITLDAESLIKTNQKIIWGNAKTSSADTYKRILSGEKVLCNICGRGYIEPMYADIPIEKVSHFKCTNCGETMIVTFKLKI